jgi:hypothetical protein
MVRKKLLLLSVERDLKVHLIISSLQHAEKSPDVFPAELKAYQLDYPNSSLKVYVAECGVSLFKPKIQHFHATRAMTAGSVESAELR